MSDSGWSCVFSEDELGVLAMLLGAPRLPGGVEAEPGDAGRAAAARGLVARGVLVVRPDDGAVEVRQPWASMLSVVVLSDVVLGDDLGRWRYEGEGCAVVVERQDALSTWSMTTAERGDGWTVLASRDGGVFSVGVDGPVSAVEQPRGDERG